MTPSDAALLDVAMQLGVIVVYSDDIPDDRDGEYDHPARTIRIRDGLHARHHRSVLAHELAHAVFCDIPSKFGPVNLKQEARAEAWAALRLIDHDEYKLAEDRCSGHAGHMAVELGVMRSTVVAYQRLMERIGHTAYVRPRMGAGQWLLREMAP